MSRRLESTLQVDDERVVDALQDGLLGLHVLDLLKADDLTLLQTLQGKRLFGLGLVPMLHQSDASESTGAQGRNEVEVVEEVFSGLGTFCPRDTVFRSVHRGCYIVVNIVAPICEQLTFGVIEYVLRLLFVLDRFFTLEVLLDLSLKRLLLFGKSHGLLLRRVLEHQVVIVVIVVFLSGQVMA